MPDATPAVTPGHQTSEHRVTVYVCILGLVLQTASGALEQLHAIGIGAAGQWYPLVLVLLGTAMQVLTVLGYQRSRALVKVAALAGTDEGQ